MEFHSLLGFFEELWRAQLVLSFQSIFDCQRDSIQQYKQEKYKNHKHKINKQQSRYIDITVKTSHEVSHCLRVQRLHLHEDLDQVLHVPRTVLKELWVDRPFLEVLPVSAAELLLHRVLEDVDAVRCLPVVQDGVQPRHSHVVDPLQDVNSLRALLLLAFVDVLLVIVHVHARCVENVAQLDPHQVVQGSRVLSAVVQYLHLLRVLKDCLQQSCTALEFLLMRFALLHHEDVEHEDLLVPLPLDLEQRADLHQVDVAFLCQLPLQIYAKYSALPQHFLGSQVVLETVDNDDPFCRQILHFQSFVALQNVRAVLIDLDGLLMLLEVTLVDDVGIVLEWPEVHSLPCFDQQLLNDRSHVDEVVDVQELLVLQLHEVFDLVDPVQVLLLLLDVLPHDLSQLLQVLLAGLEEDPVAVLGEHVFQHRLEGLVPQSQVAVQGDELVLTMAVDVPAHNRLQDLVSFAHFLDFLFDRRSDPVVVLFVEDFVRRYFIDN